MSAAASATSMSCFSPRTSTRKNSRPSSVPTNGVSGGTPAAARWRGVSDPADTVMMPTRLPGGSIACTQGTWISALVATGTRTCAASSAWNSDRKPQLVVIASAPSRHQFRGGGQEVVQQSGRRVQHHAFRRRAAHHAVQHRERPGGGVAHVAGDAGKLRLQHQDSERRAVQRLAALGDDLHCASMPQPDDRRKQWPSGRSPRLTLTCSRSGTRRRSATASRSPRPERRALRLHGGADGLPLPQGEAHRRPGARRHDPLHRAAARQGDRPRRLVRLRGTPPISRPSR